MPAQIRYTLSSEGPSDRVLMRHIEWALEQLTEKSFSGEWADPIVFGSRSKDVASRILESVSHYPCNILFVHRDADGAGYLARRSEIAQALRVAGIGIPAVPIVPVRMTESWLLFDEHAIRSAAGRPSGGDPLGMPPLKLLEDHADPKRALAECLCLASGTSGRRLDTFKRDIPSLKYRVADLVQDFSVLQQVSAFSSFMDDLRLALDQIQTGSNG